MLKNVLIVVDDIEKSIEFYRDLFGLQVILKNEGNVILPDSYFASNPSISKSSKYNSIMLLNGVEVSFNVFPHTSASCKTSPSDKITLPSFLRITCRWAEACKAV